MYSSGDNTHGELGSGTEQKFQPFAPLLHFPYIRTYGAPLGTEQKPWITPPIPELPDIPSEGASLGAEQKLRILGTQQKLKILTPVLIPGLQNVNWIAAGYHASFCSTSAGHVYAFGDSFRGQLGIGLAGVARYEPTLIPFLDANGRAISADNIVYVASRYGRSLLIRSASQHAAVI